jgi:hypothetical protein
MMTPLSTEQLHHSTNSKGKWNQCKGRMKMIYYHRAKVVAAQDMTKLCNDNQGM